MPFQILDDRDNRITLAAAPDPELVRYYLHLQKLMKNGEEMSRKYRNMSESLHNGESTYPLEEAKILRLQVLKVAETVDGVSKKISSLEVADSMTATLQNRIRMSAVTFVKETLVGLPSVPSEDEFKQIKVRFTKITTLERLDSINNVQVQKAQEAAQRIADEKRAAEEAKLRYKQQQTIVLSPSSGDLGHRRTGSSSTTTSPALAATLSSVSNAAQNMVSNAVSRQLNFGSNKMMPKKSGGGGGVRVGGSNSAFVAQADRSNLADDPLVQQINNLKVFIQQAKSAGRHDDAASLETNLRDLQVRFKKAPLDFTIFFLIFLGGIKTAKEGRETRAGSELRRVQGPLCQGTVKYNVQGY